MDLDDRRRKFVDKAPDAILTSDADGTIRFRNLALRGPHQQAESATGQEQHGANDKLAEIYGSHIRGDRHDGTSKLARLLHAIEHDGTFHPVANHARQGRAQEPSPCSADETKHRNGCERQQARKVAHAICPLSRMIERAVSSVSVRKSRHAEYPPNQPIVEPNSVATEDRSVVPEHVGAHLQNVAGKRTNSSGLLDDLAGRPVDQVHVVDWHSRASL